MSAIYENFYLETEELGRKNLVEWHEISGVPLKTMYSRYRSRQYGAMNWTDKQIIYTKYLGNGGRQNHKKAKISEAKKKEKEMFNERAKFLRRRLCW